MSTAGGTVSGTQASQAVAGTVTSAQTASTDHRRERSRRTRRATSRPTVSPTPAAARCPTGSAVSTAEEQMVPLAAFSHYGPGNTPLAVNHQGTFVATTISFNLGAERFAQSGHRGDRATP